MSVYVGTKGLELTIHTNIDLTDATKVELEGRGPNNLDLGVLPTTIITPVTAGDVKITFEDIFTVFGYYEFQAVVYYSDGDIFIADPVGFQVDKRTKVT